MQKQFLIDLLTCVNSAVWNNIVIHIQVGIIKGEFDRKRFSGLTVCWWSYWDCFTTSWSATLPWLSCRCCDVIETFISASERCNYQWQTERMQYCYSVPADGFFSVWSWAAIELAFDSSHWQIVIYLCDHVCGPLNLFVWKSPTPKTFWLVGLVSFKSFIFTKQKAEFVSFVSVPMMAGDHGLLQIPSLPVLFFASSVLSRLLPNPPYLLFASSLPPASFTSATS